MAKTLKSISTNTKEDEVFQECRQHYNIGFHETDRRATGKNRIGSISFNEADELFRSWIDENKWPYDALLFDPRVFTFIFEKTSRLISNKPQGKLIPREGSDVIAAKINNELLSYQWDLANHGGTMLSKWSLMDINTRKYGSGFAIAKWRYETDADGKCVFDGPEMEVLNNRDVAHDLTATAIESANWFLVRQYVTVDDLQNVNDQARTAPIYKNLDKLKYAIEAGGSSNSSMGGEGRDINWISRNRTIAGLETDPYGKDKTFPTIEIVTEYRRNRWITFAPKHNVILRDIDNPYKNNEIPVVMLRYYAIDDDLYGVSEIEPIKGLQKAINAILCQYVDEINQKLYSPIAVGPGVKQHTLDWGKGARWIMNNPMTDFRLVESRSNAAQFFNNTYSVLVAAMMNALGESSLGNSNTQPYQTDKTATEVKALQIQRNSRDNYNQIFLAEAIKRQYMLWHSMNQELLFADPKAAPYIFRITGPDTIRYFQQEGLDSYDVTPEDALQAQQDTQETGEAMNQATAGNEYMQKLLNDNPDLAQKMQPNIQDYQKPKYPVTIKGKTQPKMTLENNGKSASLAVEPKDVKGMFDFAIDVESMTVSNDEQKKQARQAAVSLLATNPNVVGLLGQEGYKPKFKELFVTWLEDLGFSDAERFFEKGPQGAAPGGAPGGAPGQGGGPDIAAIAQAVGQKAGIVGGGQQPPTGNQGGIPGGTNPNAGGEAQQTTPFAGGQPQQLGPVSPKAVGGLG